MDLVDWKLYTSLGVAILAGILGIVGNSPLFGVVLAVAAFLVLYVVLVIGHLVGEQVRSRAS